MRYSLLLFLLLYTDIILGQTEYWKEIKNWDSSRVQALKAENGWLNLAGLFWLKEGQNTYGTHKTNDLVFPKGSAAKKSGTIILKDGVVTLNDKIIFHSDSVYTPVISYHNFNWSIIKREEKYGIRLRNLNSALIKNFKPIDRYPADTVWRVRAFLQKANGNVMITNVLGQTIKQESPGKLIFTIDNKTFSLDAMKEGDQLFIIFGDETCAVTTYGAGRYMYAAMPDKEGYTILDFNKAFNPPCAFTNYATCPLPPKQNILPIEIRAGEKDVHMH